MLLLLLGGALLRISTNDLYLRYVLPSHRWLLLAGGGVIIALAVSALVQDHRRRHDHDGHHGEPLAWLLLLPVLVIALVVPPALGADSVARAGYGNAAVPAAAVFPPLPAGAAPEIGLGEVVQRAMFDTTGALDGHLVTVVGFAVRRGGDIDLARLRISCCAADARASRVRLVGGSGDPAPDTWLRVVGEVRAGTATAATHWVPTFTVRSQTPIPAPSDPYEY